MSGAGISAARPDDPRLPMRELSVAGCVPSSAAAPVGTCEYADHRQLGSSNDAHFCYSPLRQQYLVHVPSWFARGSLVSILRRHGRAVAAVRRSSVILAPRATAILP